MGRRSPRRDRAGKGTDGEEDPVAPSRPQPEGGGDPKIRAWLGLALLASMAGLVLRLAWPTRLPDGPFIDETAAIRAGRVLQAAPGVDLFGVTPLLPPEVGHAGAYESNLYLYLTGAIDRVAGGGMASVRAVSLGWSVVLFVAGLLLSRELAAGDLRVFASAAVLLAGSGWLLRIGRWGWFNLWSSALLVLALTLALRSARTRRIAPALLGGGLLGLAQYGYLLSRVGLAIALVAPLLGLLRARRAGDRTLLRVGLAVFLTSTVVAFPLFATLARHPEQAAERLKVLAPKGGPAGVTSVVLKNVRVLVGLVFGPGDPNPRHAEPGRPLFPLPVGALVAVGVFGAVRAGGARRATALAALGLLATNLATKGGDEAANSFRVVAAAAPLLALAAFPFAALSRHAGRRWAAPGALVLTAALVGSVGWDVAAFVRWGTFPGTNRLFAAPERGLADRLRELGAGSSAEVLLAGRASREMDRWAVDSTTYLEYLLSRPGSPKRGLRVELAGLPLRPPRFAALPARDVLYVDLDTGTCGEGWSREAGAVRVARIPATPGLPPLCVLRWEASRAREIARAGLVRFARLEPSAEGEIPAEEDGLYGLSSDRSAPGPRTFLYLSAGRYRTEDALGRGARLTELFGPDGFPRRVEGGVVR